MVDEFYVDVFYDGGFIGCIVDVGDFGCLVWFW